MGASFERLADGVWLMRAGPDHRDGIGWIERDPYVAVANVVRETGEDGRPIGVVKGFAGADSIGDRENAADPDRQRFMRSILWAIRAQLGLRPEWTRGKGQMDYGALRDLIATMPDVEAATDQEVADWCNAAEVSRYRAVPAGDVRSVTLISGEFAAIKLAAEDTGTAAATRALCINTIALLNDRDAVIDFREAAVRSTLGAVTAGLVAAGLIAQSTADTVMALGVESVSRGAGAGLPAVVPDQVYIARGGR